MGLSRERQGLNGKWESNAKKAEARRAKRASLRLGPLLVKSKERRAKELLAALREARALTKELHTIGEARDLEQLLPRLEALMVTGGILRRTMIPKVLQQATERVMGNKVLAKPLLLKWREIYRQDVEKT